MRALLWFVFGIIVAASGQAFAQYFDSTDNQGNVISGYTDPSGQSRPQRVSILGACRADAEHSPESVLVT